MLVTPSVNGVHLWTVYFNTQYTGEKGRTLVFVEGRDENFARSELFCFFNFRVTDRADFPDDGERVPSQWSAIRPAHQDESAAFWWVKIGWETRPWRRSGRVHGHVRGQLQAKINSPVRYHR